MKKQLFMIMCALAWIFTSCESNRDLWREIDDLKSRVSALETQVAALNGNIDALSQLYGGATVSSVEERDGKWVITLSNGDVVELVQGSEGNAVLPVVSIDGEGCWQVSYDGGATFESLNVSARAEDGVTPRFRIDDEGYWQVSYDNGDNWERVTDPADKPVSAVGSGSVTDKFFEDVRLEGDELYIKLLDGSELRIPVLADFMCRIDVDDEVQMFDAGQERRFNVEIRGVENTIVTAPEGWSARLTEPENDQAELIVKAPSTRALAADTRATADSSQDVAILATSGKYACIAKMKVETTGQGPAAPPSVTVTWNEAAATYSSLTFDIVLENADKWYWYRMQEGDSEAEIDAEKVRNDGTRGTGSSLVLEELEADTEYTVFVVAEAANGDLTDASKATGRTTVDTNDLYEAGVEINGVRYSKDSENVRLITSAEDIANDGNGKAHGIYFVDTDETVTLTASGGSGLGDFVIIGRYADKKANVKLSTYVSLKATGSGSVVFKNVKMDGTAVGNYLFNTNGTATLNSFVIEDCEIETSVDKPLGYFSTAAGIKNIVLRNNKIHMNVSADDISVHGFNYAATFKFDETEQFTIDNNVIYAERITKGGFINTAAGTPCSPTTKIDITNNTFVNYRGVNAYVVINDAATVNMLKNIMWSESFSGAAYLLRINAAGSSIVFEMDNCIYNEGTGGWTAISQNMPTNHETSPAIVKAASDPFGGGTFDLKNGVFVPAAAYSDYGSTLK